MMPARRIHALLVAANLFWYQAIRQTVGVLAVAMGHELHYSANEKGWLIAAPSVGNIITQLVGGRVEQAIGARATVTVAVTGLACGCLLVPVVFPTSLQLGLLVLAVQGFFFGPMFPAHSVMLSRWTLPSERGWASAQGELAISLASMGAPLLAATLESTAGWRAGFYVVGAACVLYILLVWLRLAYSSPGECPYITTEELTLLGGGGTNAKAGGTSSGKSSPSTPRRSARLKAAASADGDGQADISAPTPASRILLHPAIVALFSCHCVYNLTTLSINSWTPSYYADVLNLPPDAAKLHLTAPHICAMAVKLCVSPLAEALRTGRSRPGLSMLASRRLMCAIGYVATALPVVCVPLLTSHPPWMTTLCFCAALIGTSFHAEGFRANYLDVTRAHVGLVSGVGNCLSSVAALVAPLIVGALVSSTGWGAVWYACGATCLLGALIFCTLSTTTPVELQLAGKVKAS